jgi:hypothetical protein
LLLNLNDGCLVFSRRVFGHLSLQTCSIFPWINLCDRHGFLSKAGSRGIINAISVARGEL